MSIEPDLTPRTLDEPVQEKRKLSKRRKAGFGIILAGLLAGLGFLLFTTLSGASFFFLDVDEAVERREDLGSERFRIQGITIPNTIIRDADVVDFRTGERVTALTFSIAFNGQVANVIHRGDQADIFQDCLPVILEGRWVDDDAGELERVFGSEYYFASSDMLVKHDNNYIPTDSLEEDYSQTNPERIDDAVGAADLDPLRGCPQT